MSEPSIEEEIAYSYQDYLMEAKEVYIDECGRDCEKLHHYFECGNWSEFDQEIFQEWVEKDYSKDYPFDEWYAEKCAKYAGL